MAIVRSLQKVSPLVTIREERSEDIEVIHVVNREAFGQAREAQIVDALRKNRGVMLSLVAVIDACVVGHILYSPVTVGSEDEIVVGAGLGPMAVLPEFQRRGIGGMLIEAGNRKLHEMGCPFIVVLGDPEYYPRFGFTPAAGYGLKCGWDVPEDVFMVLFKERSKAKTVSGVVKYRQEFSNLV